MAAARREQRELEEPRGFEAAARSERALIGRVVTRQQDRDALPRERVEKRGALSVIGKEEVSDREAATLREPIVDPRGAELTGPDRARNVGENPCAVALAINDARPVRQAGHAVEDEVQ